MVAGAAPSRPTASMRCPPVACPSPGAGRPRCGSGTVCRCRNRPGTPFALAGGRLRGGAENRHGPAAAATIPRRHACCGRSPRIPGAFVLAPGPGSTGPPSRGAVVAHTPAEIVAFVFIDLAVIMVLARLVGRLAVRLGQPAVIGEIIAGILLGPTLLGALPGNLDMLLFPADVRPFLNVLAQLGLVLFMFLVGLEVDLSFIRGRERVAVSVSVASIVLPFSLGVLLATVLHRHHDVVDGEPVRFLAFGLFLGVAMSITAFPVLARILAERRMHRIPIGVLSLACAAVDDMLAWTLLAVVVAVVAATSLTGVAQVLVLSVVFALVMFLLVRPLLKGLVDRYQRSGRLTPDMLAVVLVGILASASVTEWIGIHFIFGAFVFGVVMPRQGAAALTQEIIDRLEQVSVLLLLPVFFVVTGLGVDIGAIDLSGLAELGLILLVAIARKF